ncbi:FG-GAP repeat-containing protein [Tanacetum coccineum]
MSVRQVWKRKTPLLKSSPTCHNDSPPPPPLTNTPHSISPPMNYPQRDRIINQLHAISTLIDSQTPTPPSSLHPLVPPPTNAQVGCHASFCHCCREFRESSWSYATSVGGYKRAHFRCHKSKAVKKTPGKTLSFPFPKPDKNHPPGKDSSKKISNIIGKAANFANSAKTKKASPYVPIITNYTQLWWLPNVVVAHGKEGIEVLHLASGRKLCKYSSGEISSTMVWDLDKKQLLSSIPFPSDCSILALAASQVHRGQYAIGFVEGSVRLYDIQTPDEEKEALKALDTTMIRFRQTEASRMALPLNVRRDGECEVHVIESVIAEPELEQRRLDDCYVTLETSYTVVAYVE